MCNATPQQKAILNSINGYSLKEIDDFLRIHRFQLSCLMQYGLSAEKLNSLDLRLLKDKVAEEQITRDRLQQAGFSGDVISSVLENEAWEEEQPKAEEPKGNPYSPDNSIIDGIIRREVSVKDIQDALLNGEVTTKQLREQCFLTDELIKRIETYQAKQMSPIDFDKLPPIKKDRTDFYFLGLPSAGKTCLIASLISHWMKQGICNPEVNNKRSVEYFRILGGGFSQGILPMSNPNSFIDYIELTLKVTRSEKRFLGLGSSREVVYDIPINLLDMAGEKFRRVADDGRENFDKHRDYLLNDNPKSIFFVLDYSVDKSGGSTFDQSLSLQVVLNSLEEMKILEHTDSIYLVVSKADLFPTSLGQTADYARKYVDESYKGFKNRLLELEARYEFEWDIIPYSIGDCMFGQLLTDHKMENNPQLRQFPEQLNQRIQDVTAKYRSGLSGLFTN
jgi:hypothetical protein